jgi:hypothetical protein
VFFKKALDLIVSGKSAFTRGLEAPPNADKLFGRCVVRARLNTFQDAFAIFVVCHVERIAQRAG